MSYKRGVVVVMNTDLKKIELKLSELSKADQKFLRLELKRIHDAEKRKAAEARLNRGS